MLPLYQFSLRFTNTRQWWVKLPVLLFILGSVPLAGQSVIRGPYLQTGTPTSVTVKWRTNTSTDSKVFYGTSQGALNQSVTNGGSVTNHELTLSGLQPNTTYYYAVGNQAGSIVGGTTDFHFVTSPPDGTRQKVRAWILGDSGTADGNAADVRDGFTTYNAGQHVDMMMMLGDNAYNSGTDSEYQAAVFNMYPEWLRKSVLWSCPGNHDYYSTVNNYLNIFTFPTSGQAGGVPSGTEKYYSYNYDNIHFISLDSYGTSRNVGDAMYNWLENDLMNVTQDWVVAFWHHPPYTKGSHDSDTEGRLIDMRENFLPLLESYGVDLVLGGHSHSYERSFLLKGHYDSSNTFNASTMALDNGDGAVAGDGAYQKTISGPTAGDGAVYIVAGSSGKISGVNQHPAMYTWQNQLGSVLMEVENGQMTVRFIDKDGNADDEFTIEKDITNQAPVASNDNGSTFQDSPVVIDVLANDQDSGGSLDPSSVQVTSGPTYGQVAINPANGEITYTPNPGFGGMDTFTYEVCDNGTPPPVLCATATVSISVEPNYAPVAVDDAAATNESTPVVISVLGNDSDINGNLDPGTVQIVAAPANGMVSVAGNGDLTYSPAVAFDGQDVFTYQVYDALGAASNVATVTVNVWPNLPPMAGDDSANTIENMAVTIQVLTNDNDPNGDLNPNSLNTAGVLAPTHGQVQVSGGGAIVYTPNPGYTGYDEFEYEVCDLSNPAPLCAVATVTVLVNCMEVLNDNIIAGTVFDDADQNGMNQVETGQGGVTVTVFNDMNQNGVLDAGDTQEAVTTTAPDGSYSFALNPVYYTPGSLAAAISQDTDDAWEKNSGDVENDKDEHEFGKLEFWAGLRFQNLNIPAGAVITNAYVEYYSSRDEDNTPARVNFYTELSSSPATFVEQDYGISSRPLSNASVNWNMGEWFEDDLYQSPDLSTIVQEVIDLNNWNSGDDLVIITEGVGSEKRKYYTHDKDPNLVAKLYVDYLIPGQDEYFYVVTIDPATLPGAALLTTDNVETAHFTALGQTDCFNDFGFFPGAPPTVSITSPADGTIFTALQTISLAATAADADGSVNSVEFFVDGVSVGVDNTAPYTASYAIDTNGDFDINALATDSDGFSTLSTTHTVTMAVPNTVPDVTITAPVDGTLYTSAQLVNITASATDLDGTVTQVAFFVDGVSVGVDNTAPYLASFNLTTEGVHTITAVADDNLGGSGSSGAISITLDIPNDPPTVSITDPLDGALFMGPQLVSITAAANDPDGSVTQVEFFVNGISIGTDNTAPYTAVFDLLNEGFYLLEAEVTDDMGATALSAAVEFEMQAVPTPVSFSVQSASDDAREKNDGKVEDDKNPHEIGKEGYIGVRFQGVSIPAGATILSAHVTFKGENDEDNTPSSARVYGQATANPSTFVENKWNISSRPQTNSFVDWTFGEWIENELYSSPDLVNIVQELVDQPAWQNGNAIAFIFEATGSERRKAYAYEESQADGPQLEITYLGGGMEVMGRSLDQPTAPSVTQADAVNLRIYPNPTDYQLFIEFDSPTENPVTINLYDAGGRLIRSQQFSAVAGFNKVDFSTDTQHGGVHYIHLQNGDISVLEKVLLLKR